MSRFSRIPVKGIEGRAHDLDTILIAKADEERVKRPNYAQAIDESRDRIAREVEFVLDLLDEGSIVLKDGATVVVKT